MRQALTDSLCKAKQTKLMTMEFQKLPTKEFFDKVKLRVKDTSAQSLNYHTGILNSMKCHSNEKRMEFADRLVAQFLVVMNLGGTVTAAWRVERLLNGSKAHPKYQLEANLLEMLPSQSWDSITNQLRQYDRSDTNLRQESANAAFPIICNWCHVAGHKSPDCPMRAQKGGKGRGGGRGSGKGYNGRGGGSKGKGYGGKGGGGGRGGGYKKGGKGNNFSNNYSRLCNLCQNPGHLAANCPHAKEFGGILKKRLAHDGGNQQRKKGHRDQDDDGADGDYGSYSFMLNTSNQVQTCLSVFTAALDSGCTSHTVKESCLPDGTFVDSSRKTNIQTASSGAVLPSHAKASNGVVQDALVCRDDELAKNLVSIPKLDRAGYTTIFSNGRGVVTDPQGNVVADAPLSHNDLYEFDIRDLFATQSALLGSVTLPESEIDTWHIRLGHRNTLDLQEAVRKNLLSGPPAVVGKNNKRKKALCHPCDTTSFF